MYSPLFISGASMTRNSRRGGRLNTNKARPQNKNPNLALVPRNIPRQNKWISGDNFAAFSASLTNAAPLIVTLNPLLQGTTNTTRIASKVRMGNLQLRLYFDSILNSNGQQVRIVLVRDAVAEGVVTTTGEVFNNTTPSTYTLQNMVSVNPSRYQILHDVTTRRNDWVPVNSGSPQIMTCLMEINKQLGFVTDYSRGNGGTVADIDTNALTLFVLVNNTVAALACQGSYQISFTDE